MFHVKHPVLRNVFLIVLVFRCEERYITYVI